MKLSCWQKGWFATQWTEEGALPKINIRNFACEDAPCPPTAYSVDLRPSSQ
jgi:hypothetical protein